MARGKKKKSNGQVKLSYTDANEQVLHILEF